MTIANLSPEMELLKDYFEKRENVLMAFIFGSYACRKQTVDSDIDIAVYLKPSGGKTLEVEEKKDYPEVSLIWGDVENILNANVDLVILNQVYPSLACNILKNGVSLAIKDENLYHRFYEIVEKESRDFYQFVEDYWDVYLHAQSLSPEQRARLIEKMQYLDVQLQEVTDFKKIDFVTYRDNKFQRRNVERWIENIANCTIDIAKIVLASEKKEMPGSYKEVLLQFGVFAGLKEKEAKNFSEIAPLRNILAHEYMDVLYKEIRTFLDVVSPLYKKLLFFLKKRI